MQRKVNKPVYPLLALWIWILLLSWGCQRGSGKRNETAGEPLATSTIRYAEGFSIEHYRSYSRVTLHNPWSDKGDPYAVYYLYRSDSVTLPDDGIRIKIPVRSLAVNSFSYFSFLHLLEEGDLIAGVTDGNRVYHPEIRQQIERGEITNLGDPFNPNVEQTMALRPDAIINSAYAERDSYSERLSQAGFPIIYSLEWMERSPLARAEWIRMIAAFVDKEALGDSLFAGMEKRYHDLQEKVNRVSQQKSIMTGDQFQGTWYVPGGMSFNATLFRDAGLDYFYKHNHKRGSIGLDIESILTQFGSADYWFGCDADSYGELAERDAKYLLLNPVIERQVFNNHNRTTTDGGNDFFESAIANPDLLLADMVKAAYPHLLPHYSFTYIKPLMESTAREE